MNCNCNSNNNDNNTVIQFIAGTTVNLSFDFDEDISSYTDAKFVIRSDYDTTPVINKTIQIDSESPITILNIQLTPEETALFTQFANGKNNATYIWGLDLIDSANNIQVNVFPKTGNPAPLCIVYKHVI